LNQTFGRVGEEREGVELERRRREIFSQNLERERRENYEDLAPKITYILPCAKVLKCPSS
jgi:hypothetical protein